MEIDAESVNLPALIEALLVAHGDLVSIQHLVDVIKCSKQEVLEGLKELQSLCEDSGRGVEVVLTGDKAMLRTKAVYGDYVREIMAVKPRRLSRPALETLAVIAYQQPVVKSEIDKIRGVDVAPTIKTLLERNLVKILGYQASVGQPALYGTTEEFLKIFGLKGLSELPALKDLNILAKEPGEVGEDPDIGEEVEEPISDQPQAANS